MQETKPLEKVIVPSPKQNRWRRFVTRFGQLPLLTLVILAFAIYEFFLHIWFSAWREDFMYLDIMQYFQPLSFSTIQNWVNINMDFAMISGSWLQDTVLLCVALFLSYLIGSVIKFLYYKPRPEEYVYKNRWQKINASSFPSIHTANSFIVTYFALSVWYWSGAIYQPLLAVWFLFFVTVSLSRIQLKKHFPIDVVAWVILGMGIVLLTFMTQAYTHYVVRYIWRFIGNIFF